MKERRVCFRAVYSKLFSELLLGLSGGVFVSSLGVLSPAHWRRQPWHKAAGLRRVANCMARVLYRSIRPVRGR